MEQTHIGIRIRQARLEKAWKQKHLAARVRVEAQTVSNWERGRNTPDLDTILLLSRELDKSVAWLLGLSEEAELAVVMREVRDRLEHVEKQVATLLREVAMILRADPNARSHPRAANGDN